MRKDLSITKNITINMEGSGKGCTTTLTFEYPNILDHLPLFNYELEKFRTCDRYPDAIATAVYAYDRVLITYPGASENFSDRLTSLVISAVRAGRR